MRFARSEDEDAPNVHVFHSCFSELGIGLGLGLRLYARFSLFLSTAAALCCPTSTLRLRNLGCVTIPRKLWLCRHLSVTVSYHIPQGCVTISVIFGFVTIYLLYL